MSTPKVYGGDSPPRHPLARHGRGLRALTVLALLTATPSLSAQVPGVEADVLRLGGVMDLAGDTRALGVGMSNGIRAALEGQTVRGRRIEYRVVNDFYDPNLAVQGVRQLLADGVFLMVGNVGTPTARVTLPLLAEAGVPAVGFFTGAGLLRPGVGDIVNFRASYVQETAAVIRAALEAGLPVERLCAFVQNDAYGMAGLQGIVDALANRPGAAALVTGLEDLMAITGAPPARNFLGPVGVYERNTLTIREGFESLKIYEQGANTRCGLVITVGTYETVANFTAYARGKGEPWVVSAVSFTGAGNLAGALAQFGVEGGVVMTQVVPPLDAELAVVADARTNLGRDFNRISLEGYIVGRMTLAILTRMADPPSQDAFVEAVRGQRFEVDGLSLDFTDDNQGSDAVSFDVFDGSDFLPTTPATLMEQLAPLISNPQRETAPTAPLPQASN